VHVVPLMIAVEGGIPAGIVTIVLLTLLGIRSLRAGGPALAIYIAYMPFVLLEHHPYSHEQGLVMTGLWLGFLIRATAPAEI